LLLHLVLLWLATTKLNTLKFLPPKHAKKNKKISLDLKQIHIPPTPKIKPIPKPVVFPSVVKSVIQKNVKPVVQVPESPKKTFLDKKIRTFATKNVKENNITKLIKKPIKKIVKKKGTPHKKLVKKRSTKKRHHLTKNPIHHVKDSLASMLMHSGTALHPTPARRSANASTISKRMIQKLYGKEFDTFTPIQKKYIRNNLSIIHQITQRTLSRNGYPTVAIQTRQQGTNVVSFYLHPNGDITGLKLKKRIGYEALDSNTLKIIRLAYKDYPLPNEKTKITFYVQYSMY